ncbi:MAG: autotransporter-associated beta strand repeat-containing protein [Kiritimatiellae bacterium]|nr:autotransporter-associated beta strand repeat-containing protein [Kiritimatiellia bacterium]
MKGFTYVLTAVAAAFFGVSAAAADVISLNFATDRNQTAVTGTEVTGLVDGVPGSAWNNFTGENGSATDLRSLNQESIDGLSVTWSSKNMYSYTDGIQEALIKDYLDDGNTVQITVTGVPYSSYDVVIYTASDNNNVRFSPFYVNGMLWTYDSDSGEAQLAYNTLQSWGISRHPVAEYGVNVMRVKGISGSTLTVAGPARGTGLDGVSFRSSLAAIQIVEVPDGPGLPAPDLIWSGMPFASPSGWFSSWSGEANNEYYRVGPKGGETLATYRGRHTPYLSSLTLPTSFTFSFLADISDVDVSSKEAVLVDFGTGKAGGNYSLLLLKLLNSQDVELAYCRSADSGNTGNYSKISTVTVPSLSLGYHLFTITFSTADGMSLKVDDLATVSYSGAMNELASGFQLGNIHGGASISEAANHMGYCNMMAWNSIFTEEQKEQLLADSVTYIGTPVHYQYYKNHQGVCLSVPSLVETEPTYLGASSGTIIIGADQEVTVSHLRMLNASSNTNSVTLNINGTVNVVSTNTNYDVYSERNNFKGILFGHWDGTGTYNITGTLVGEHAYLQTVYSASKTQQININGGTVKVRGLYARSGYRNSSIRLYNGGTLEFADYQDSGAIPLTCEVGTIRACSYEGSDGWTYTSQVTFNNADAGTLVDPNGLNIAFSNSILGGGKVIVRDSSVAGNGSVAFPSMNGYTGNLTVEGGVTINLSSSRPEGTIVFSDECTLVLKESLADEDGYVNLNFSGTPNVVMYRPDGTTLIDDAEVVTENGVQRIRYTPLDVPQVSGVACWMDFEFDNYSVTSIGYNNKTMTFDATYGIGLGVTENNFKDLYSIYTASEAWMDISYPNQWSAAIYATIPQYPEVSVMTFGTNGGGLIGLIAGTAENEVLLVRTTGNSHYTVLASMTVPNASTAQHLYVFSKRDKHIDIYLDGILWTTYTSESSISFGNGFQMGSVHGSEGNTGIKRWGWRYFGSDNTFNDEPALRTSYIGMLRLYDTALSASALDALAAEFPYVSPNGLFSRSLTGSATAEAWSSDGAWTKITESGSVAVAAPDELAVLRFYNNSDNDASLATDFEGIQHFESFSFYGDGKITLAAGGGTAVNDGATFIDADVVIEYGAATVSGGPLTIESGASLTFDYSNWPIDLYTPNQTNQLTGISSGDASVTLIAPANTLGRTFELFFNDETSCWCLSIIRGNYALNWKGDDQSQWDADTVWENSAPGADAAFLIGDAVNFPGLNGKDNEAIDVVDAFTVTGFGFTSDTTSYLLTGANLTVPTVTKTGRAALLVNNTLNVTSGCTISAAGGGTALRDVRGTVGSAIFQIGSDNDLALLGTAGTLNVSNLTFRANLQPVVDVAEGGTVNIYAPALTAPSGVVLHKTGAGTLKLHAGSDSFVGGLVIDEGRVEIPTTSAGLPNMTATRDNPLLVNEDGYLLISPENWITKTFPDGSVIKADGGYIEVNGNNIFSRDPGKAPVFVVENGGTVQFNGTNEEYDLRVEGIELNNSTLLFAGTTANWHNRGVFLAGGTLYSVGDSFVNAVEGCPNRLDVEVLEVNDGTLTVAAPTEGNLVKTGNGTLVLNGLGGSYLGIVDVRGGTIKATEALSANNDQLLLSNGTTLDLSGLDGVFGGDDISLALAYGAGEIYIDIGDREVNMGDQLVAWGADGEQPAKYLLRKSVGSASILRTDEGLFVSSGGTLILFR